MRTLGCVVVFSKPAQPGRVKTRLVGDLTPAQTAQLHQAFLDDLIERLRGGAHEVWLAWALDPGQEPPTTDLPALVQRGENLGERLFNALERVGRQHEYCAAVGSDHPELPLNRPDEAFERLAAGADLVLGPASDGGYYLVAVRRQSLHREVFEGIPWSTPGVLETTLARGAELGLRVELLELGHDVDRPEDLPRLQSFLEAHPSLCPRTRVLFERWGLAGVG